MSVLFVHGWAKVFLMVFGLTSLVVGIYLRRTRPEMFKQRLRPDGEVVFESRPWWARNAKEFSVVAQGCLAIVALIVIGIVVWMAFALLTSLPGWS